MPRPGLYLAALPLLFTALTQAATPEAWASHDKNVLASCLKASQLKNARAGGSPALFDDSIGYTALLIKGTYPQAFMKGRSGTELCLYHRARAKAVVTPWDAGTTVTKP